MTQASSSRVGEPRFDRDGFAVEATEIVLQTLIPDVAPITPADRLALRAEAPMRPTRLQKPCDFGLFDLAARQQLDLFAQSESKRSEDERAQRGHLFTKLSPTGG